MGTLAGQNTTIQLALDAQPPETVLPKRWMTSEGSDGRTRGGRDRVWIVADVVLAVKVSKMLDAKVWISVNNRAGWPLGSIRRREHGMGIMRQISTTSNISGHSHVHTHASSTLSFIFRYAEHPLNIIPQFSVALLTKPGFDFRSSEPSPRRIR